MLSMEDLTHYVSNITCNIITYESYMRNIVGADLDVFDSQNVTFSHAATNWFVRSPTGVKIRDAGLTTRFVTMF
eukprot:UN04683